MNRRVLGLTPAVLESRLRRAHAGDRPFAGDVPQDAELMGLTIVPDYDEAHDILIEFRHPDFAPDETVRWVGP